MKISFNWLKEYIDIDLKPEDVAKILTNTGLEVEGIEKFESVKGGLKGVVIGHVKACTRHPDADKLSLTAVDIGNNIVLPIVCGAPNVAAGQKVVVATVGAVLYSGDKSFEIKKTKIRGHVSEGMICAEDELGLGDSHDGIMVLPDEAEIGTPASEYFQIEEDHVFEIGLTPNRTDAMSHIGVARDLMAAINLHQRTDMEPLKIFLPCTDSFKPDNNNLPIKVIIEDTEACPRYSGVSISGVEVKESPEWLKNRLLAIGVRPINNLVDISNFVLHETGHPNHFFDADKIAGNKVIIKKETKGTKFITLDETERELTGDDLMICDAERVMCMAGVFGGMDSGVTENTKNLFIESACFDSKTIRKTARHHGLNTDSSFRFERGADPNATIYALKLAAMMVKRIAGGIISSDIVDVYPKPVKKLTIKLQFKNADRLIGQTIPRDTIKDIMVWLGMEPHCETDVGLLVDVPTFKTDVTREADLIEEILRIYGYNNIQIPAQLRSSISHIQKPDNEHLQNIVSDYLAANGFYEIINNSLTKSNYAEKLDFLDPEKNVRIFNPLSNDLNVMRQILVTSGLETINYNLNRKNLNLKLFEFGNVYSVDKDKTTVDPLSKYQQSRQMTIFVTGNVNQESWYHQSKEADFYYIKNVVLNMLRRLKLAESIFVTEPVSNHVFETGVKMNTGSNHVLGYGLMNKKLLYHFDIKQPVYMACIQWDFILKAMKQHSIVYRPVPKFPEVRRDLALIVDKEVEFETLQKLSFETEKHLLKNVNLFDVYEGEKIGVGKKSYAISFILQDETKTLTDKTIDKTMAKIQKIFETKANARLR
jgi:phenylalanyl-tRNA synthetase beta chain